MRYYAAADVHGFYTELMTALKEQGYFEDTQPHKLVLCGDLFDRGGEAVALQEFLLQELEKGDLILIRGNHEDLAEDLLKGWHRKSYLSSHHVLNGTVDTACQLAGIDYRDFGARRDEVGRALLRSPFMQTILPAMVDYHETEHYIFVHGWIPCEAVSTAPHEMTYTPTPDWRQADKGAWDRARWVNGMEAHHFGIREPGKTIVCGHWHCSFGHAMYEGKGGEFDNSPDFSPYRAEGILALDTCTALTRKVNCVVLED